MPTVTGYTAAKMQQIEDETVVDGNIVGNDLILVTRGGPTINAGNVRGPQGIQGLTGEVTTAQMDTAIDTAVSDAIALVQAAGAVTNAMLALNAVTETRIADSAVTTTKIANGAITTPKVADRSITNVKIALGNVGAAEIANGAVGNAQLANGSITSDKIADGSIAGVDLANGAVTYWKQGFIFVQASQPPVVDGGIWIVP